MVSQDVRLLGNGYSSGLFKSQNRSLLATNTCKLCERMRQIVFSHQLESQIIVYKRPIFMESLLVTFLWEDPVVVSWSLSPY